MAPGGAIINVSSVLELVRLGPPGPHTPLDGVGLSVLTRDLTQQWSPANEFVNLARQGAARASRPRISTTTTSIQSRRH
ncbi:MAG TPA: hypothetical protein VIW24_05510 [Aldersonia sp.]